MLDDGLELLDVHLHASVAGEADDAVLGLGRGVDRKPRSVLAPSERGTHRCGQVIAHSRGSGVDEQSLIPLEGERLDRDDACRTVRADHEVARVEAVREPLHEHIGIDGRLAQAIFRKDHRVARLTFPAP